MPNRRHLRLVPPKLSEETIRELETLLRDARAGITVGLAYVAIAANNYTVNAVGQANARPTMTRGMLRVLDDLLRERHRHRRQ